MKYLLLVSIWSCYCFLHSALISFAVTDFLKNILKDLFRYYRLFYNFISILLLIPLLIYTESIGLVYIFTWESTFIAVRIMLLAAGAVIVISAMHQYDMFYFLGIRQLLKNNKNDDSSRLNENGILGLIRHPFYSATFVFIWCRNITAADLTVNIILSLYLLIGTVLEEKKLTAYYGNLYRDYMVRVSMYLPFKWLIRQIKLNRNYP